MSLATGKQNYIDGLIALQQEMLTKENDSFQYFAEQQANLIEAFIKTAEVKSGIPVTTSGSALAQTGQTTQKGQLE